MLAPAAGFYSTPGMGKNEVRIAFILNSDKLLRAAKILEQGLQCLQENSHWKRLYDGAQHFSLKNYNTFGIEVETEFFAC